MCPDEPEPPPRDVFVHPMHYGEVVHPVPETLVADIQLKPTLGETDTKTGVYDVLLSPETPFAKKTSKTWHTHLTTHAHPSAAHAPPLTHAPPSAAATKPAACPPTHAPPHAIPRRRKKGDGGRTSGGKLSGERRRMDQYDRHVRLRIEPGVIGGPTSALAKNYPEQATGRKEEGIVVCCTGFTSARILFLHKTAAS